MRMRDLIGLTAAVTLMTGCLSRTHYIPRGELQKLAQQDPNQRAERVRVIQRFDIQDEPPTAQPVRTDTVVVISPGVHSHHHGARRGPAVRRGTSGTGSSKVAKDQSDRAYLYLILAAGVGITLAATEGARYDGWVKLHPMHPVHLYGPGGSYTRLPLAHIDPQTAAWARRALVREGEGPWTRLGRAPLNRAGWTYAMQLGAAELSSESDPSPGRGFMGHIQVGHFPTHEFGILFDIGLGWRNNNAGERLFESRWALELQLLPFAAGKLHAGAFGQAGVAARFEDAPVNGDRRGTIYGGGGLVQLELTTRLALTLRGGITNLFDEWVSDIGLGLSIY